MEKLPKENTVWVTLDMYDMINAFPEIKEKTDIHLMPKYIRYSPKTHIIYFAFDKTMNWPETRKKLREKLYGGEK